MTRIPVYRRPLGLDRDGTIWCHSFSHTDAWGTEVLGAILCPDDSATFLMVQGFPLRLVVPGGPTKFGLNPRQAVAAARDGQYGLAWEAAP